ncbi:MAG: hypothetical protein K9N05_07870 [Candidatus Marinimicrobia bacterium]|nr:hypothetical protein [Candidatus Neomarinimicrobiota bacterium]
MTENRTRGRHPEISLKPERVILSAGWRIRIGRIGSGCSISDRSHCNRGPYENKQINTCHPELVSG